MQPEDVVAVRLRDLVAVLRHLETIVVSLDHLGSATAEQSDAERADVLLQFMVEWGVFGRLADARAILSDYFSRESGGDDMDELEREMHDGPVLVQRGPIASARRVRT